MIISTADPLVWRREKGGERKEEREKRREKGGERKEKGETLM